MRVRYQGMSTSESNKPDRRWRWVVPAALLPGAIVYVINPHQTLGFRIVAWVMLALIVILLGYALYANDRQRRRRWDASHGT
jgi:Flp pilus assembly protein TadB